MSRHTRNSSNENSCENVSFHIHLSLPSFHQRTHLLSRNAISRRFELRINFWKEYPPVHQSSRAGLEQSSAKHAHVILRAITRMRVISEFLGALEFQRRLVPARSGASWNGVSLTSWKRSNPSISLADIARSIFRGSAYSMREREKKENTNTRKARSVQRYTVWIIAYIRGSRGGGTWTVQPIA